MSGLRRGGGRAEIAGAAHSAAATGALRAFWLASCAATAADIRDSGLAVPAAWDAIELSRLLQPPEQWDVAALAGVWRRLDPLSHTNHVTYARRRLADARERGLLDELGVAARLDRLVAAERAARLLRGESAAGSARSLARATGSRLRRAERGWLAGPLGEACGAVLRAAERLGVAAWRQEALRSAHAWPEGAAVARAEDAEASLQEPLDFELSTGPDAASAEAQVGGVEAEAAAEAELFQPVLLPLGWRPLMDDAARAAVEAAGAATAACLLTSDAECADAALRATSAAAEALLGVRAEWAVGVAAACGWRAHRRLIVVRCWAGVRLG